MWAKFVIKDIIFTKQFNGFIYLLGHWRKSTNWSLHIRSSNNRISCTHDSCVLRSQSILKGSCPWMFTWSFDLREHIHVVLFNHCFLVNVWAEHIGYYWANIAVVQRNVSVISSKRHCNKPAVQALSPLNLILKCLSLGNFKCDLM